MSVNKTKDDTHDIEQSTIEPESVIEIDDANATIVTDKPNVTIDITENAELQTDKPHLQKPALTLIYWCIGAVIFWLALLLFAKPINTLPADVELPDSETTVNVDAATSEMSDEEFLDALYSENVTGVYEDNGAPIDGVTYYTVDRTEMQSIANCVGYINIEDTYVSDWVVQANDNTYYLDVDAYGNDAENGAVFGDYRNDFDVLNANNIIYAHNMADGTRFGTLQRLAKEDFYKDEQGTYKPCDIEFDSPCYNNVFRVYSVYEIDLKTFNYIRTTFDDDVDFGEFVEQTRSYNAVNVLEAENVPANTKLLTLSTCTAGGAKRLVVHAYLYARETV